MVGAASANPEVKETVMEQFFQIISLPVMLTTFFYYLLRKVVMPCLIESTKRQISAKPVIEPVKALPIQKAPIQIQKQPIKRRRSIGEHYHNYGRKSALRSSFTQKDIQ
jgi:hypothetical protein